MSRRMAWLTFVIAVIFGLSAAFVLLPWDSSRPSEERARETGSHELPLTFTVTSVPPGLAASAFSVREPWRVKEGTRVAIVPHHVAAAKEIASLVGALGQPSVAYLVAPDHFSKGRTAFTTGNVIMRSPEGAVATDERAMDALIRAVPSVKTSAKVIEGEHGVTALAPFLARAMPGVPVVPIAVRIDADDAELASLTDFLAARLRADPKAFVLGSIDFSHYLPADVADFHDALAEDVIRAVAIGDARQVEIDSPVALAVTLGTARALGLGGVTIHAHTNSLRLLKAVIAQDSTSHFLVSFAPGAFRSREVVTRLFVGPDNVMTDENRFYQGMSQRLGPLASLRGEDTALGAVFRQNVLHELYYFPYKPKGSGFVLLTGRGRARRIIELKKKEGVIKDEIARFQANIK